ncbi:MAG TPA: aminoacyl-tRNA hydrolase [Candidatus Eisenbacteria bacterium]
MAVVLGLGNPGARYARTRHNAGARVVEALVGRWTARPAGAAPEYRAWEAEHAGRAVGLLVARTHMNESGRALAAFRERHPFEPADLLVVTDDVYLPLGMVRLRARGSSGGHRGLASVEEALGSRDWARLRVGVGVVAAEALGDHVLEEFGEEEVAQADEAIQKAADAVECWAFEGLLAAMNRFNRRVQKEVPES